MQTSQTISQISEPALALLGELTIIPQVVGYDHRIRELDEARPRLIEWVSGQGYLASDAGRDLLARATSAPVAFTYNDLLNDDGTRNDAAYRAILSRRIESEVNAHLVGAAGLSAPHGDGSPLGSVPACHAALVKLHGLGPISQGQREKIAEFHRGEMDAWVLSEQRRAGIEAAPYLVAAE